MRKMVLIGILFLYACAPQGSSSKPGEIVLTPYLTITPSATPDKPEGLVVSVKTPIPTPTPFIYVVKEGDTLGGIADQFNVQLDVLQAANPGIDPNNMAVGSKLKIPSNQKNTTGEATPTPVSFPVEQIACHPTVDSGMWCFALVHNDSNAIIEDISAQVTLLDTKGQTITSQTAFPPLDILPPDQSLPISIFFQPNIPINAKPQVQILTGIRLLPGDARYLPAIIQNTLVQVDWSGFAAQVNGQVLLPADAQPAQTVWVAAVAYDGAGNVAGVRRWESPGGIAPGGSLQFSFVVASIAGRIERVDFVVEARP